VNSNWLIVKRMLQESKASNTLDLDFSSIANDEEAQQEILDLVEEMKGEILSGIQQLEKYIMNQEQVSPDWPGSPGLTLFSIQNDVEEFHIKAAYLLGQKSSREPYDWQKSNLQGTMTPFSKRPPREPQEPY
jgi:hypothetical protein